MQCSYAVGLRSTSVSEPRLFYHYPTPAYTLKPVFAQNLNHMANVYLTMTADCCIITKLQNICFNSFIMLFSELYSRQPVCLTTC